MRCKLFSKHKNVDQSVFYFYNLKLEKSAFPTLPFTKLFVVRGPLFSNEFSFFKYLISFKLDYDKIDGFTSLEIFIHKFIFQNQNSFDRFYLVHALKLTVLKISLYLIAKTQLSCSLSRLNAHEWHFQSENLIAGWLNF